MITDEDIDKLWEEVKFEFNYSCFKDCVILFLKHHRNHFYTTEEIKCFLLFSGEIIKSAEKWVDWGSCSYGIEDKLYDVMEGWINVVQPFLKKDEYVELV